MSFNESDKNKKRNLIREKEEIAIAMIEDGEPFDKIEKSAKISLDRILQLADDLKKNSKSKIGK